MNKSALPALWLMVGIVIALIVVTIIRGGLGDSPREAADTSEIRKTCAWENTRAATVPKKRKASRKIMLTPAEGSAQRVINVDEDRDIEYLRLRLETNQALPRWLKPEYLEIYADPLVRTGDEALETVSFPQPRFIKPRILSGGRRIDFGVCLEPASLPAGRYTGVISIGGPPNISGATVAITANAKDSKWFVRGSIIAFLAALLTLLFRGTAEKRLERRPAPTDAIPNPPWPPWRESLRAALRDPQFLFTSVAAIATAFGALYTSYANGNCSARFGELFEGEGWAADLAAVEASDGSV